MSIFRYIGNRISEADARLIGIKPPDSIARIPRGFRGRAWKGMYIIVHCKVGYACTCISSCTATECRTFLLYYLPILHGILPDKFLAHALLLSKAIRILLSDEISHGDIKIAENLLRLFWRLTENYYGLCVHVCMQF